MLKVFFDERAAWQNSYSPRSLPIASALTRHGSEELRRSVRRVLADPSFAENARRIGEKLRMEEFTQRDTAQLTQ
jgi:UDP:flavonoid glycosyltransferase YjiC (YdhE family)